MKRLFQLPAVCISAILLTLLFYQQGIGLNLLLFEGIFLAWLFFTKQASLRTTNQIVATTGFLLTGIFTVITYSVYAYVVHFLLLFVFIGMLNLQKARSLLNAFGTALTTLFTSQSIFWKQVAKQKNGAGLRRMLWSTRIFFIPALIITIFISLYSFSNNIFGNIVGNVGLFFQNGINYFFQNINFSLLFTFLFCGFISVFLMIRKGHSTLAKSDAEGKEYLERTSYKTQRKITLSGLKSEYKAGVFLLLTLNTLLLLVNSIDVFWVWFNFEWEGQTLKQFVHEGTYLLILSILISIAVVLYFFRGNLNFYKNNRLLRMLSYIWIFQNAVLTVSVMIRNYWYIEYFAMAYKRIGVLVFLLLTLYGLYTVMAKIRQKKTAFYLFRTNTLALIVVLVLTSCVNWDRFIAGYNFAHAEKSYLHYSYLSSLSDKALPALAVDEKKLRVLDGLKRNNFDINNHDMSAEGYLQKIEHRKKYFKQKWESKNILSWNLAEYLAYHDLFK